MRLVALATDMLSAAVDDRSRAFAHLQLAWGYRYRGDADAASASLQLAAALYDAIGDLAGQTNCRDLSATLLSLERRYPEAIALLQVNLALPPESRHAIERMITHDRSGLWHDQLGDRDQSPGIATPCSPLHAAARG